MSFPAYSSYNSSGIDWLGDLPNHWRVEPVKRVAEFQTGWTPPTGRDDLYGGSNIWVTIGDLGGRVVSESAKQVTDEAIELVGISASPKGSLLFSFKLSIGQVAFAGCDLFTNEAIATFLPGGELDLSFAYYALPVFVVQNAAENIYGAKLLNQELIRTAALAIPPANEQAAIAVFLDRETAKIDALVEEQLRLIELLKEKRQAVISHAVTKGLDPRAPMKDSDIEWLGEVPEHWQLSKVKFATSHVVDCLHTTPTYEGDLIFPAIRTADIEPGRLLLDQTRLVSRKIYEERIQRLRPAAGDILYSREGERFGMAALVPDGVDLCLGQRMMMFRSNDENCSKYLMWTLNSNVVLQQVDLSTGGSTSPHINISDIVNFDIPRPPQDEQQQISDFIDERTGAFDELIVTAEGVVALLQERRSALIAAAVTGKIDVRVAGQVLPLAIDRVRTRGLVGSEIIERSARQASFGRVKLQKIAYLAEAHVGVSELEGNYLREAAGPLDREMVRDMEREAGRVAGIRVDQPEGAGTAVRYRLGDQSGAHRAELTKLLGDDRGTRLDKLIDDIATIDTKGTEAVATLYAVWNDALIDGEAPTDSENVLAVLTEWHPEKKEKFRMDELHAWLSWMRRHGLVPTGTGPRTSTGRLFP